MNARNPCRVAAALAAMAPALAFAQGIATERQIESITVTGQRATSPDAADVPNPTASRTAEDLRLQNLVNPEDALKYLPDTTIRKRYIGDRNALIGGRSFSTLQAARGLVLADGYLISNFLGQFDAPRWNMVAPEEIQRVDVLYGPFSAIYPGNSIGTTVVITTRAPRVFEASVRTTTFSQRFSQYGDSADYNGFQTSAFLGGPLADSAWVTLGVSHEDSIGQPMQYFSVSPNAAGQFPAPGATAIPVTGVTFDTDPKGRARAIFGTNAEGIDHTIQDHAKLRLGYTLAQILQAEGFVSWWRNDSHASERSFLRDSAGNTIWSGRIAAGGAGFDIPASAFAPSTREEEHVQRGITLRTRRAAGWNGSLVLSDYTIKRDLARQALTAPPDAANGGRGTVTSRAGTGWQTLELQGIYSPVADDFGHGKHALTIGYHQNEYELRNPVFLNTADWRVGLGSLNQNVFGKTRLQAVYVQDRWQVATRWTATLGVRYEKWRAFDGGQLVQGLAPVSYAARDVTGTSPKLSIAYEPNAAWLLRLSAGRGVRLPTVVELFQGTNTGKSIQINDPNLQPERSNAVDLTVQRRFAAGSVRVSAFQDDIRDTIWSQTDLTVNVTTVQNIGRVRSRGIETALELTQVGIEGLRLEANAALVDSKILENSLPSSVAKQWLRVPRVRANVLASYRPTPPWMMSLGVRHSGKMYGQLDNSDFNGNVYGGVSSFTVADARVSYTTEQGMDLAVGVENLTDQHYYQFHPFPGRTLFAELRWSYGAAP